VRATPTAALAGVVGPLAFPALAARPDAALPPLAGAELPLAWGIPFAGLLLSIALVPLASPRFWHAHYGKIALAWALALLVPLTVRYGAAETLHHVVHALALEYVPFIVLLFSLFTIAGGICVRGALFGTPARNTLLLALGAALASFVGTTGASMLLIRPLLAANALRRHRAHAVVFFILLVGNVGGALTPLGDPPLFIGFLKGVDFFWPTRALAAPTALLVALLLAAFWLLDRFLCRREAAGAVDRGRGRLRIEGAFNLVLVAGVIGAVLMSGLWEPGIAFDGLGTRIELENVVREGLLIALALVSLAVTPAAVREHNRFHWAPIVEVAKLFAGIFVTIIPVIAILGAGRVGALAGVRDLLVDPASGAIHDARIFWVTGLLSAFLDNAPTYLVFFNLAGGDAVALMGPLAKTLAAISMGAVYFGALTYVGNAPNFMIKAIAEDDGVAMPSFFAYLGCAGIVLLPLMALVGWVFV